MCVFGERQSDLGVLWVVLWLGRGDEHKTRLVHALSREVPASEANTRVKRGRDMAIERPNEIPRTGYVLC